MPFAETSSGAPSRRNRNRRPRGPQSTAPSSSSASTSSASPEREERHLTAVPPVVVTVAEGVEVETFTQLGVPEPIVAALAKTGVTKPFPIQAATLPDSLAGRDVLGRGRTGSGKTLAFAIPHRRRARRSGEQRRNPAAPGRWSWCPPASWPTRSPRSSRRWPRPLVLTTSPPSSAASAGSAGHRPAQRRRHPRRLPRPARGPHRAGSLPARRGRGHRARRGRSHGRPRLPARRQAAAGPHPATASGCCSRRPSTTASTCWSSGTSPPGQHSVDPSRRSGRRHDPPRAATSRGADKPRRSSELAAGHGRIAAIHAHQARGQEARQAADHGRRTRGRTARQPGPGRPRAQPRGVLRRHRAACWSRPTSPPVASTSTTSAWSSTSTRPPSTRRTCTAPAAPPAPAPRVWSSRSLRLVKREM